MSDDTIAIRHLDARADGFDAALEALLARGGPTSRETGATVRGIVEDVRERGDEALLEYTRRFDGCDAQSAAALRVPRERLVAALEGLPAEQRSALEHAAARVRDYHTRHALDGFEYQEADGTRLGQRVTPLDRVGVYVPGGKAAYPSTVLMTVIPARVAGVREVIMAVPTPHGEMNALVLAAAQLTGVDAVFTMGGAQAVAALAYGTESVPAVDKIVGPGNQYVAEAKRIVFGQVGIDMIAGPSEVVIVAEGGVDPRWVAMDLFAQAEHDEQAQSILVSPDTGLLAEVAAAMSQMLPQMERREIIRKSLESHGAFVAVRDLAQAAEVVDRIAPEHLELQVADPRALMAQIRHAGAVFLGRYTAEVLGDYCAGPNHTLPTSGTARFSSPLGVYDFQKRTSIIECVPGAVKGLARTASVLARAEGLTAHARSAELRLED